MTVSQKTDSKTKLTIIYSVLLTLSLALLIFGYTGRSADNSLRQELQDHGEKRVAIVTEMNTESSSTSKTKPNKKGITLTDHVLSFKFLERPESSITERFKMRLNNETVVRTKANPFIAGTDYVSGAYYDTLKVGNKIDIIFVPGDHTKVKILNSDGDPYFLPYANIVFWFGVLGTLFFALQLYLYRKKGINL